MSKGVAKLSLLHKSDGLSYGSGVGCLDGISKKLIGKHVEGEAKGSFLMMVSFPTIRIGRESLHFFAARTLQSSINSNL
jgi:hypothetical protein